MAGASTPDDRPAIRVLFGDQRPGETPIDDCSGLKVRGISTLRELDFHEAANIANAIVDYLRQGERKRIDFGLESVKSLHKDMFCDVWDWAGTFLEWPNAMGETSPVRGEYIESLKAADDGDYAPLVDLHRRFLPMPARPMI